VTGVACGRYVCLFSKQTPGIEGAPGENLVLSAIKHLAWGGTSLAHGVDHLWVGSKLIGGTGMREDAKDFGGDLIDVSGVSLQDIEQLPDTSLKRALRETMVGEDVGHYASFSAQA
jgi:hypothetical protein